MLRVLTIVIALIALAGCRGQIFSSGNPIAPKPFRMGGPDKNAPPDYLEGWNDGCNTGLSTMVNGYYKSFYKFEQDPYKISNPRYYKAWQDAYHYCRQYSFRFTWNPYDRTYKGMEERICVICPNELDRAQ